MVDKIIPALIFLSVVALGSTVLLVRAGRSKRLRARLGDFHDQTDDVRHAFHHVRQIPARPHLNRDGSGKQLHIRPRDRAAQGG